MSTNPMTPDLARLRELLDKATPLRGGTLDAITDEDLDFLAAMHEALPSLLALAEAVEGAPVTPITTQTQYPTDGIIPTDWDDPCFETTYARLIPCDKDGRLVRVPDAD